MAYHFRFESVLGYRRNLEDQARQKLTMAQAQLERQEARLTELAGELEQALTALEERKSKPISAPFYVMLIEGIEHRERDIAAQQRAVADQRRVVEETRQELVEKMRQRKTMEKARQRDYQRYLHEELHKEQTELDEQMILRFKRP